MKNFFTPNENEDNLDYYLDVPCYTYDCQTKHVFSL